MGKAEAFSRGNWILQGSAGLRLARWSLQPSSEGLAGTTVLACSLQTPPADVSDEAVCHCPAPLMFLPLVTLEIFFSQSAALKPTPPAPAAESAHRL